MVKYTLLLPFFLLAFCLLPSLTLALSEIQGERRYLSLEEIRAEYGEEVYQRMRQQLHDALREAELNWQPEHSLELDGETLRIEGDISDALYADIAQYLDEHSITRFAITSGGGYVASGLDIAFLMLENGIEIEVEGYCVSSCANYLFIAGADRIIRENSAVIWHGNTLQLDVREFFQCGQMVSALDGEQLTEADVAEMTTPEALAERARLVEREQVFFSAAGVDEFIARVGQEPVFHGNFTMAVEGMELFGLTNVSAPPGYGTTAFCERFNADFPAFSLYCLSVSSEHWAHEEARRRYGEICSEDGRLVIDRQGTSE